MQGFMNRRGLVLLSALLASQVLSACVVVPAPYYRQRPVIVEPRPHYGPPHDHRDPRDRRDWHGRR
jgi:hypothetical protein